MICMESHSESIYACPSVFLSMYFCEQSTVRIYYPIQLIFCTNHLFDPRTNPIEIGDNRSIFRYSYHIYLPPICFLLCTKCLISARIAWNFAHTIKLGLKISIPNLIEIGSDIAIAPIYIVHPIYHLYPPQP